MKGFVNLTHTNNGKINQLKTEVDNLKNNVVGKDTTDLENYYTKDQTYTKDEVNSKVTNIYKYKGSVQTYADLPTENNQAGDVWNVIEKYESYPAGTNFAWTPDGTWDALGGTIEVDVGEPIAEAIRDNTTQIVPTSGGLKLGGAESAHYKGIAIGENAKTNGNVGIAIGLKTVADGNWNVAIGNNAYAFSEAIGLGYNAKAKESWSIQLGTGINSTPNSFQIRDDNIYKTDTHTLTVQNIEQNGNNVYGVLQGETDPTEATVGAVSQFYLNTTDKKLWQCVAITTTDATTYTWTKQGGKQLYQHTIGFQFSFLDSGYLRCFLTIVNDNNEKLDNLNKLKNAVIEKIGSSITYATEGLPCSGYSIYTNPEQIIPYRIYVENNALTIGYQQLCQENVDVTIDGSAYKLQIGNTLRSSTNSLLNLNINDTVTEL